ncbi:unnamed protein product, partial [Dibothriocephalus latus]
MRWLSVNVAAIQETNWTTSTKVPSCADYTMVRRDRGRNKGGSLTFLVDKSLAHYQRPLFDADPTEVLAMSLDTGPFIRNIYIPPISSCPPGFIASIVPYIPSGDSLVLGDFNAHHD